MKDNKVWVIIITCVTIMLLSAMVYGYNIDKKYIENGYEKVMLVGSSVARWNKVNC